MFGRNAAGGAINIVTKTPSDTFSGKVVLGTGNLHSHNASIYLTGPIVPDPDKHYFSLILQTTLGTIGVFALPRTFGANVGYQF